MLPENRAEKSSVIKNPIPSDHQSNKNLSKNIVQVDGCVSVSNLSDSNDATEYETDEEMEPIVTPPAFQTHYSGNKPILKVSNISQSTILPLCL